MRMNHGYSILELLIALALFGIALELGASTFNIYIRSEGLLQEKINHSHQTFEAWEKFISVKIDQ